MEEDLFDAAYWAKLDAAGREAKRQAENAAAIASRYQTVRPYCHEHGSYECDH